MNEFEVQTFGQLVRELRQQLDLTQKVLADKAGCATISIRRIEAGALRPSTQLAEQLAIVFEIPREQRDAFIKLARDVSNSNGNKTEESQKQSVTNDQGIDSRMWRHTESLLTLLPLIFATIVLIINPRYLGALTAIEPPFIIANILPCGWLVFVLVFVLMVSSKYVLQHGRQGESKHLVYYRTGLNGFVLMFMTFPALLLILLVPALLQLLRSGVLDPK